MLKHQFFTSMATNRLAETNYNRQNFGRFWLMMRFLTRRRFVILTTLTALDCVTGQTLIKAHREVEVEETKSDLDAPSELVTRAGVLRFAPPSNTDLALYPPKKGFANALLGRAKHYASLNINRHDNQPEITRFLSLVNEQFSYKGKNVAYCAAGVTFAACEAYASIPPPSAYDAAQTVQEFRTKFLPMISYYYFAPTSSVVEIADDARRRHTWRSESVAVEPQAGWLVIYSFLESKKPSHIGVVEAASKAELATVEFNTTPRVGTGSQSDGGYVARKTRTRPGQILGYVAVK